MATHSKEFIEAVERLLGEVNEECDRAWTTCSKLDRLQRGSLDYEDGLEDLADQLEHITAKLETLCEALQALEKPSLAAQSQRPV